MLKGGFHNCYADQVIKQAENDTDMIKVKCRLISYKNDATWRNVDPEIVQSPVIQSEIIHNGFFFYVKLWTLFP